MFCSQCGLEATALDKFCSRCGNILHALPEDAKPLQAAAAQPAAEIQSIYSNKKRNTLIVRVAAAAIILGIYTVSIALKPVSITIHQVVIDTGFNAMLTVY